MPAPTDWQPAPHPTVPGYFCLQRYPTADSVEQFGNRVSATPPIEAFATQEQALRVADYVKGRRGRVDDDLDVDLL